jgi:hypothetical protein
MPAACWAFDAQHEELADQTADRSVAGHAGSLSRKAARPKPPNLRRA